VAGVTLEQFEFEVTSACAVSPIWLVSPPSASAPPGCACERTWRWLFIEAFYNQATGKTAFALIQANQRILARTTRVAGTGIHGIIQTAIFQSIK